jgi:hypothetical protein
MRPRRVVLLASVVLLAAAVWAVGFQVPPGPRSARVFEPDRLADLEAQMWRDYYQQQNLALFRDLVITLRQQFRYPWGKATRVGLHLARAAATFGTATGDYQRVLPDLEAAYTIARDWTGAHFDPAQVARAELAWWVARRDPRARSPENVGRLLAVLYARFYEVPESTVAEAGLLRARAAALRDRGGGAPDWPAISALLRGSYRSLRAAVR